MSAAIHPQECTDRSDLIAVPASLLALLLRERREDKAEIAATRALMSNPHWDPADARIAYNTLTMVGAAPGVPPKRRPQDFMPVTQQAVARASGLSREQCGARMNRMFDAGLFRHHQWKEKVRDEDGKPVLVKDKNGEGYVQAWQTHSTTAPPDGADWVATWADPGRLGPLPPAERMETQKDYQRTKREHLKKIAQQARAILERCPHCGADPEKLALHSLEMQCGDCQGVIPLPLEVDPDPQASRARKGRRPRPRAKNLMPKAPPCDDSSHLSMKGCDESSHTPPGGIRFSQIGGGDPTPAPDPEEALAAAVAILAPAFEQFPNHVEMRARAQDGDPTKYITVHTKLDEGLIARHLRGQITVGAGLFSPDLVSESGRMARAIAWDSDCDLHALINGGLRLRQAGLSPLLVANPTKARSGHLWLLFERPTDPAKALAAAEKKAPELRSLTERFPDPTRTDGRRLRLPGGVYLPVGFGPVPVKVALAPEVGRPVWVDGTTPEGWATIAGAVSDAGILEATWLPPEQRPRRPAVPRRHAPVHHAAQDQGARDREARGLPSAQGRFDFAAFNREHPIESMVEVGRDGKFKAPWRDERTPSVQLYDDHWFDYGDGRWGRDAFDLWCGIKGYWNSATNRADRKAAIRALRGGG